MPKNTTKSITIFFRNAMMKSGFLAHNNHKTTQLEGLI